VHRDLAHPRVQHPLGPLLPGLPDSRRRHRLVELHAACLLLGSGAPADDVEGDLQPARRGREQKGLEDSYARIVHKFNQKCILLCITETWLYLIYMYINTLDIRMR